MLDVVRVLASAVVAFAHLTQRFFSSGWPDLTDYAWDAVAVFFVLSGFVIRHVTVRHKSDLPTYFTDRLTRIYSVAIPALAFTFFADLLSKGINPAFYSNWATQFSHPVLRILINLAFCGQLWNHVVDPMSNSPYWSINYEVAYYLGYGCFFYLAGKWRWLSVLSLCLLFGPHIVFLAPLWIGGWLAHDLYQRWLAADAVGVNLLYSALAMVVVGIFGIGLLWVKRILSSTHPILQRSTYPPGQKLLSNNYLFGVIWMLVFLALLYFARKFTLDPHTNTVKAIRFIAEGTFPLYLFHFPLYVLIASCIHYDHGNPVSKILMFISVLVLGILAGHPCNLLKTKLRSMAIHLGIIEPLT